MNLLIRFQHPDWIFMDPSTDDVDGLMLEELEELESGEGGVEAEEIELLEEVA